MSWQTIFRAVTHTQSCQANIIQLLNHRRALVYWEIEGQI